LQKIITDVEALGANLVVISPQREEYSRQVAKKRRLTFRVLRDQGNQVASLFGLTFSLPENLKEIYRNWGIDLDRFNGEASWTLPMPGRFILDEQGTILNAAASTDYTKRPEPEDVVTVIRDGRSN
jgi:peroxiredoxin